MSEGPTDNYYRQGEAYDKGVNVPAIARTNTTMNLSDLSETAFHEIVNADVRGTLDSQTSAMLREPENVPRWHDTLLDMKRSVEAQLTAKKGELAQQRAEYMVLGERGRPLWAQAQASAGKWKQGSIRFKNGVETKIAEAKRLLSTVARDEHVASLTRARDRAIKEALVLRTAIIEHRARVMADDDNEEIDDHLWSVLDS